MLPKLKEIWDHQLPLDSFSNLQILKVENCSCLLSLIPCHLIQSLKNLKEIEVRKCEVLKRVLDLEGVDRNVEILPKLETLKLEELSQLRWIVCNKDKNDSMRCLFSPSTPINFYNLKYLFIEDCAKEDKDEAHVNTPIEDEVLFTKKVSFPNLNKLKLNGFAKLKKIWHHQLPLEFFCNLRILSVYNCPCLINLIPSHLIQSLQNLKKIDVQYCEVLEYVFDHGELNGDVKILPKIETLKLVKLPRLGVIICNEDKNGNIGHLLSPSAFKNFQDLKELYIHDCGMLLDEKCAFPPNLEVLVLQSLSKLKEINVGNLQKLKILQLEKLPRLSRIICNEDKNDSKRCLLSPSMFKNFHNLKKLHIIDCGIEEQKDVYTSVKDAVLFNKKVSFPNGVSYEAFESRASTLNKIMDTLRDGEINLIGVWGMGGVGITTLVKQVAQQAKQLHLFSAQVYIDVSWTRDSETLQQGISDIQQKFADMLGFEFVPWQSSRAYELMKRLKTLNILIILDDMWQEIDLEEVGIPCKECKIVLTSRDEDLLCKDMGAQICFPVKRLLPQEAWSLFKKTAGDSVEENLELQPIANEIVEECEGLPIAIVTIAKALKDETVAVWKNALEQLRTCAPTNIRAEDEKVYSCLEFSYNHLKGDDQVKSLFFLCGSLRHHDISMDHLLQYGIGLDLFDRINSLEDARNKLVTLVKILKASSLLFDSEFGKNVSSLLFKDADDKFVRINGVARDIARSIASKDPHPFVVREDVGFEEWLETDESKRCTFISLNCKLGPELPHRLVCPELQIFLLQNNNPSLNIPNTFFEGMTKLKVLDLSKMDFTTLPSSLDSLANLRTFRLNGCKLVDIALIGKLTKLEVLSLVGSTIQQLSNEMVQLTNLRLLDLNDCKELEVIPRNILSSLSRLECLSLGSSFTQWAYEGESNACLSELNHLSQLTTLDIDIPDAKLLPKDILFENLTRYTICIGNLRWLRRDCKTKRALKLEGVLHLGDGISKLLEKSEELEFAKLGGTKYVLSPSDRESFLELKHLRVCCSPKIQYVIDPKDRRLEEVWHDPIPVGSFGNLKTLHVDSCDELKFLFVLSMARGLSQLEEMKIENCWAMQQIIACKRESEIKEDGGTGTNLQLFPKLRTLQLKDLPELINFSSGLETTSSTSLSTNAMSNDSFFNHQFSFPIMEELTLIDLPKLKDTWFHKILLGSYNLQRVKVSNPQYQFNLVSSHLPEIHVEGCKVMSLFFKEL